MRSRVSVPRLFLQDAVELLGYLLAFCLSALLVWLWGKVGAPWEVEAAGYVAALFGLVGLAFLCAAQDIRLFRVMRTQWRRTFPRHQR
jgi:hypothetical protein